MCSWRPAVISDEAFLAAALDLFRTYGFEGVSLKRLSDATGLEKASLYHCYPGGKDEIAMAIANDVVAWFQANVFAPLVGDSPVRKRVVYVSERLKEFYSGGSKACLMDVLSIPGGSEELQLALRSSDAGVGGCLLSGGERVWLFRGCVSFTS